MPLRHVLHHQQFQFGKALAILLKGCTPSPANYTLVAVGKLLNRLYPVLNARLVAWSVEHGLRSPVQAAVCPRQSAIDRLFALRDFNGRTILLLRLPLYVCFLDVQKAYDAVQHELLWARLQQIGIGTQMLAAIQSLYSGSTLSMKLGGTAGQPRLQQNGFRQDCALSPTLFGIFFDCLHAHLDSHVCTMHP